MRRKASRIASGWSWRLAGVALCAFFGLGFLSGAAGSRGNPFVQRTLVAFKTYKEGFVRTAALVRQVRENRDRPAAHAFAGAVALVERHDGLYCLLGSGELLGPLSPGATDNLPVISGDALEAAGAEQMVESASVIVRAEALLGEIVSEMHVGQNGEASLFLDSSRTEIALNLDNASIEMERAAAVLRRWRSREDQIAGLDMTVPGEAVVRLREPSDAASDRTPRAKPVRTAPRRGGTMIAMRATDGGGGGAGSR